MTIGVGTRFPLRALFALLAVVALVEALAVSDGFYAPGAIVLALLSLLLALAAALLAAHFRPLRPGWGLALLGLASAILSGQAVFSTRLYYPHRPGVERLIVCAAVLGWLVNLSFAVEVWLPVLRGQAPGETSRGPGWAVRVALLFLAGAGVRGGAVVASPEPLIDVHTWLTGAPGFLAHGENPYAVDYPSPYETERGQAVGREVLTEPRPAAYPPLPVLLGLPCHLLGVDVRWANVSCDLLAAGVLFAAGRGRLLGALAAGLYLHLPRVPFMLEEAWFEPMLAALLGGGLLLVERGRKGGYLLLALGLTGKQFGVALLPPLWRARRREWRWLVLGLAVVFVVVFVPFLLWGPYDFLSIILFRHLARPPQHAALTAGSAVYHTFGVVVPRELLWLVLGGLVAAIAWRTPQGGCSAGVGVGAALLVFCLFHTQGFFNYFYLCNYLLLLGVVDTFQGAAEVSTLRQ